MSSITLYKIKKAQKVFENFRTDMEDERDKAGAVQAFEFCYELSWKMMKRVLASRGQETGSPKDTFRKAALERIINNPETWFVFQELRNLTVHTYENENLEAIVENFDLFSSELQNLITNLEDIV